MGAAHRLRAVLASVILIAMIITSTASSGVSASAEQGKSKEDSQKGWCFGFGLGAAPYTYESRGGTGHSGSGFALRLALGYGFTKRDGVIVETNNAFAISREDNRYVGATQIWRGASWIHYYGLDTRPYFTMLGLGVMRKADEHGWWDGVCPGVHMGVGWYMFAHVSVSAHGLFGMDRQDGKTNRHAAITCLVTAMAY